MLYSSLLATFHQTAGSDTGRIVIGEDWLQGRSLFGGLQAALGVFGMRHQVPTEYPLRTLQTTFMAPVGAGEVQVHTRLLRRGRHTVHALAELRHQDQVAALVVGVFGQGRDSVIERRPAPCPRAPSGGQRLPWIPGVTPAFTQHFTALWLEGGFPFSGSTSPRFEVDVGMKDEGPVTEAHVIAIADFVPPVALSLLSKPAAGSSLTWLLELTTEHFAHLPLQGWRVDAEMTAARQGYTSQDVRIWSPQGELAALSRQSMVVFG